MLEELTACRSGEGDMETEQQHDYGTWGCVKICEIFSEIFFKKLFVYFIYIWKPIIRRENESLVKAVKYIQ